MGNMGLKCSTYIIGFCFMDCGPLACGFAYSGPDKDGKPTFDQVKNVNIKGLFWTYEVKHFLASWNCSV